MITNPIIFYIASGILIVSTLLCLSTKNIITSLLWAIIAFFSGGLFFYILGSEYNAIIQAAVYGLAIPIIIGLSIMFCSAKNNKQKIYTKNSSIAYTTFLCGIVFTYFLSILPTILPDSFNIMQVPQINSYDVLSSFAKGIFIDYVWAFELLSLILTIIIAGLTLFQKKKEGR